MDDALAVRKFKYTLRNEDSLPFTIHKDILKLVDKSKLPPNFDSKVPPIVPSYTLMKYMELSSMITANEFIDKDKISLGYYFDFKPFQPIYEGYDLDIIVNLKRKNRKILYFVVDVYYFSELVAKANHNRFVTDPSLYNLKVRNYDVENRI